MRRPESLEAPIHKLPWLATALLIAASPALAQSTSCPAITDHADSPADIAYAQGKFSTAEDLYAQQLLQQSHDPQLTASLVRALLRQDKLDDAVAQLRNALPANPHSAPLITASAEVELRQGQPWQALQTLDEAAAADRCYARIHLIRSRIFRIDSRYASQRAELQAAYDIDPRDPDILHEWRQTNMPANDIQGIQKSMADSATVDPEIRRKAQDSVDSMMTLLSENSGTCTVDAVKEPVTIPINALREDTKHISGYQLEALMPQGKARLRVDTAASGFYISRAMAEANGMQHAIGDPADTVRATLIRIGPVELHDCMVGVTDQPFTDRTDGFVGTDVFASDLITLDFPAGRLNLAPLPPAKDAIPGDRIAAGELRSYAPLYHRHQFLLVPVTLDNRERRLFALDSGIRITTMTPEVAHIISKTKVNFTNPVQTTSGATLQVYRDRFDFQFADLTLNSQGGILQFDPATINQSAGMQIAGMIGFDMLGSLVIHLDYRDGLAKFESTMPGVQAPGNNTLLASAHGGPATAACQEDANSTIDWPLNNTIEASVQGWLDSGHIKPGQSITLKVVHGWQGQSCMLPEGSMLYGHAVASTKSSGGSELALVFDQGECFHEKKKPLPLKIIGLVGPPGEFKGLHGAMPTEIRGGARQISDSVANMDIAIDQNLNPGGPPRTVHPGVVASIPAVRMSLQGGPQCSTLLSSNERSIHIGAGAEFILLMEQTAHP